MYIDEVEITSESNPGILGVLIAGGFATLVLGVVIAATVGG